MTPPNHQMTPAEWALLGALSLLWGGSFLFIGIAVRELPPMTVVFLRLAIAAILLQAVVLLRGGTIPRSPAVWGSFAVMGVLNNVVPFCLIAWAQTRIFSGTASVLNAATPLFTVIAAHFLTRNERATPARLAGVVIGTAGVAVLIGPDAVRGLGSDLLPELAILGACVCYALSSIYGRRFSAMGIAPARAAAGQLTAAAVVLAPIVLVVDRPLALPPPSTGTWLAVLGLAILATVLAYIIFYRILATAGATNLMLVTLLIPPSAMVLGVLFLQETVSLDQLAGLALIALGLTVIDGRLWPAVRRRLRPA